MKRKPKLYAVIYRFHEPHPDGSSGVVIFNRRHTWKRDQDEINHVCEHASDEIQSDELGPGQVAYLWHNAPKPTREIVRVQQRIGRNDDAIHAWAQDKFTIGLFLEETTITHPQHATVQ